MPNPSDPRADERLAKYARNRDGAIRWAKRKIRTDLTPKGWHRMGYATSDVLDTTGLVDTIPRVHFSELSVKDYIDKYERPRVPVVITGLTDSWKAPTAWSLENLRKNYAETHFQVGWDEESDPVTIKMKYFLDYVNSTQAAQDDSPLYIFDSNLLHDDHRRLLSEYKVADYWKEDLMKYLDEDDRPPYRWVVIGPARSGTWLHLDPLYTSAWNTLVSGTKRWVFFPPKTDKQLVAPSMDGVDSEGVSWFAHVYPMTQRPDWKGPKPIEMIQRAGETLFVPGGWWHAVMNLDMTVAVTQNYACTANFGKVWAHVLKGRPDLAPIWLQRLKPVRPDLVTLALDIQKNGCADCEASYDDDEDDDDDDDEEEDHKDSDDDDEKGSREGGEARDKKHTKHSRYGHSSQATHPIHAPHAPPLDEDELEEVRQMLRENVKYAHADGWAAGDLHRDEARLGGRQDGSGSQEGHEAVSGSSRAMGGSGGVLRDSRLRKSVREAEVAFGWPVGAGGKAPLRVESRRLVGQELHVAAGMAHPRQLSSSEQMAVAAASGGLVPSGGHKEAYLLAHGGLMAVSWILLLPLAVMLGRHKWVLNDRKLQWLHGLFGAQKLVRGLGYLAMLLGFMIGLVALDPPSNQMGKLHFFLGCMLFSVTTLNILDLVPKKHADAARPTTCQRLFSWAVLEAGGIATVAVGIILMHQHGQAAAAAAASGYTGYAMWLVPVCGVAGAMALVEIALSRMRRQRGWCLHDSPKAAGSSSGSPASSPGGSPFGSGRSDDDGGKYNKSPGVLAGMLHFRPTRYHAPGHLETIN